jgi:hypothetical protein
MYELTLNEQQVFALAKMMQIFDVQNNTNVFSLSKAFSTIEIEHLKSLHRRLENCCENIILLSSKVL